MLHVLTREIIKGNEEGKYEHIPGFQSLQFYMKHLQSFDD